MATVKLSVAEVMRLTRARHPFTRGDVVHTRFPHSLGGSKNRPAVVLSTATYHAGWDEVLVVGVTSKPPGIIRPTDYLLLDWNVPGWTEEPWTKAHVETVHRSAIERLLGRVSERDLAGIEACVKVALGV